jgi:hypothetical protein
MHTKITMRCYLTTVRILPSKRGKTNVGEDVEEREPGILLIGI